MISKKLFSGDGTTSRFLSDFIVRSEQFARPYVYIYDNTLASDGSQDKLVDGTTDQANWSWPDNIWKRGANIAQAADLITADKWDVVDNSILFYSAPIETSTVWLEVATTSEEFGDTLVDASVLAAQEAAEASAGYAQDSLGYSLDASTNGQLEVWNAEAEALNAASYATQAEDTFVDDYASDGDGTFTPTPTTDYSALHWATKSSISAAAAAASAATNNLPTLTSGDVGKYIRVNATFDGYEFATDLTSGAYTPTVSNTVNVASATQLSAHYIRFGNIVHCTGSMSLTQGASGTPTTLHVSLPIASDLTVDADLSGLGVIKTNSTTKQVASIRASISLDKAEITTFSEITSPVSFKFTFTYEIK